MLFNKVVFHFSRKKGCGDITGSVQQLIIYIINKKVCDSIEPDHLKNQINMDIYPTIFKSIQNVEP